MSWTAIVLAIVCVAVILLIAVVLYTHYNDTGKHRHQLAHAFACGFVRPWLARPVMQIYAGITIDEIVDGPPTDMADLQSTQLIHFTVNIPSIGMSMWKMEAVYSKDMDDYIIIRPYDTVTYQSMYAFFQKNPLPSGLHGTRTMASLFMLPSTWQDAAFLAHVAPGTPTEASPIPPPANMMMEPAPTTV